MLLDRFEALLTAQGIDELWSRHLESMADYGFTRLLYGHTRQLRPLREMSMEDVLVLSNHPSEYLDAYHGRGYYRSDPVLNWVVQHDGPCTWGPEGPRGGRLTDEERRTVAFNRSMGLVAGYTIGFRDASHRSRGAIGLCAAPGMRQAEVDEVWRERGREIVCLNHVLHLRVGALPLLLPNRRLTRRQREVLEWVSDGLTTQEIAERIGVTPATVEKHLRLAREVLRTDTTTQAVLKAMLHNQIFAP